MTADPSSTEVILAAVDAQREADLGRWVMT
jgi:hypothetical protein